MDLLHTALGRVLGQPLTTHHLPRSSQKDRQPNVHGPTLQMRKQKWAAGGARPKPQAAGQRLQGRGGMARLGLRVAVAPGEEVSLHQEESGCEMPFLEPCSCVAFNHRLQIE